MVRFVHKAGLVVEQVFTLESLEFTGPLDLLLSLVRRNEMDVTRVNVAVICDQYIALVEAHRLAELEDGYAFLVLASTLLEIKSRSLLPADKAGTPEAEEEIAAADELAQSLADRLQIFETFKNIAKEFEERLALMGKHFPGGVEKEFQDQLVLSLEDVSLFDLMQTFERVLSERRGEVLTVTDEARPIEEVIEELLSDRLLMSAGRPLAALLYEQPSVLDIVVTFLAILELIATGRLDFSVSGGEVIIVGA